MEYISTILSEHLGTADVLSSVSKGFRESILENERMIIQGLKRKYPGYITIQGPFYGAMQANDIPIVRSLLTSIRWKDQDIDWIISIGDLSLSKGMAYLFISFVDTVMTRTGDKYRRSNMNKDIIEFLRKRFNIYTYRLIPKIDPYSYNNPVVNPLHMKEMEIIDILKDNDVIRVINEWVSIHKIPPEWMQYILDKVIDVRDNLKAPRGEYIYLEDLPIEVLYFLLDRGYLPEKYIPLIKSIKEDIPNPSVTNANLYTNLAAKADAINVFLSLGNIYDIYALPYAHGKILQAVSGKEGDMISILSYIQYPHLFDAIIKYRTDKYQKIVMAKALDKGYFYLLDGRLSRDNLVPVLAASKGFPFKEYPILFRWFQVMDINIDWFESFYPGSHRRNVSVPPDLWKKMLANAIAYENMPLISNIIKIYKRYITPEMKASMLKIASPTVNREILLLLK